MRTLTLREFFSSSGLARSLHPGIDGSGISLCQGLSKATTDLQEDCYALFFEHGGTFSTGSGLITRVTLPNSKFKVRLPMYEYWNAVSAYERSRRGTIPDYVVETKTADLMRGVDQQLDLALKLAGSAQRKELKPALQLNVRLAHTPEDHAVVGDRELIEFLPHTEGLLVRGFGTSTPLGCPPNSDFLWLLKQEAATTGPTPIKICQL